MPNLLATLGQQYEIIAGTGIAEYKTVTFDGSANGNIGTLRLFQVSGLVSIKIYPYGVVVPLSAGGGTVALGTTLAPTGLITTTTATAIHTGFDWIATPAAGATDTVTNYPVIVTGEDIILTIATGNITAGTISFTAIWKPLSPGATVTAYAGASSASPSMSPSSSQSPSSSASASLSPSSSASRSLSPSSSASPSSSVSPSASASRSLSPSSSASASLSPSSSASVSTSASLSPSSSNSASVSPSASASSSGSPSSSASPSLSPSSSVSPSSSLSFF